MASASLPHPHPTMEIPARLRAIKTGAPLIPRTHGSVPLSSEVADTYITPEPSSVLIMDMVKDCKQQQHLLTLEVNVLSARSLKRPSSLFSWRLRPYVTLSTFTTSGVRCRSDEPPYTSTDTRGGEVYRTRVDEHGAENPTWGDTVSLPVDPSFLNPRGGSTPAVHLLVLSRRRLGRPARVGWCRIPASDVVDGLRPPCSVRCLSYALRNCQHGGRGHGVVDVAVRLAGPTLSLAAARPGQKRSPERVLGMLPAASWAGDVAIGIPVRAFGLAPEVAVGRKERGGAGGGAAAGENVAPET